MVATPEASKIGRDESEEAPVEETSGLSSDLCTIPKSVMYCALQNNGHRRLLHHYDHIVAPNMAWADSPGNPWRHIIIPMAFQSPALLSAILAFAAKHIDAIKFSNQSKTVSNMPSTQVNVLQQRAMKLLAQEVQDLTRTTNSGGIFETKSVLWNRTNAILATMLVLANVETVWPDSSVWQIHLNAARTVLTSRRTASSIILDDYTSTFLEQELFIASTFASTTNFVAPILGEGLRSESSEPGSIFVEFLKLLEMVTSLERQAAANPSILSGVTLSGLMTLFENARARVQASKSYDFLHLGRTVNCFYHAGLIYACRALLKGDSTLDSPSKNERDIQIMTSTVELFRFLDFAEPSKPTFAQDLVWPLFIAGTEASRKSEQDMVVTKLQQAILGTGFSNNQHSLEFLKALWERKETSTTDFDWISFAREWTGQGRTFLVF